MPTDTSTDATVTSIDEGRAALDAVDAEIIALLARRRRLSSQVQRLRMAGGGSRVEHSRENEIIRRWATALGDGGADLALAVLAHCRGRTSLDAARPAP